MVKFAAIALLLISAVSVQACVYCQCLLAGGQHCCLKQDSSVGNLDCATVCKSAKRPDGASPAYDGELPCGNTGAYRCASIFQAENRVRCV
ncbi:hypothetical protein NHQ30_000365 [Ciborinia camelliae]|nr:hypothetical protein NHQ30_000365 [Ciborinia camelliae]